MQARLIPIDPLKPDPEVILQAVEALQRGELVVFPTETVYGIAADPLQPDAMQGLYGAKERPANKPIAWFAADTDQVRASGVEWRPEADRLANAFWPGPLTLVLPHNGETLGFRIPDHAVPQAILTRLGRVMAVTSANRSGTQPVASGQEALEVFAQQPVLILDAGPAGQGVPSTVVQVDGHGLKILRAGALAEAAIRECAG